MTKNIKKHFLHYLVYLMLFGGGLIIILLTEGNIRWETLSILLIGGLYVMWGIVHHYTQHQLHPRVVVEYVLVVMLGIVLALFLFGV